MEDLSPRTSRATGDACARPLGRRNSPGPRGNPSSRVRDSHATRACELGVHHSGGSADQVDDALVQGQDLRVPVHRGGDLGAFLRGTVPVDVDRQLPPFRRGKDLPSAEVISGNCVSTFWEPEELLTGGSVPSIGVPGALPPRNSADRFVETQYRVASKNHLVPPGAGRRHSGLRLRAGRARDGTQVEVECVIGGLVCYVGSDSRWRPTTMDHRRIGATTKRSSPPGPRLPNGWSRRGRRLRGSRARGVR